jgi:hypothetical protein
MAGRHELAVFTPLRQLRCTLGDIVFFIKFRPIVALVLYFSNLLFDIRIHHWAVL